MFFKNIIPSLGPIPDLGVETYKAATSKSESEKDYLFNRLKRKSFQLFFPAGSQIKKTKEGSEAFSKGGSFTESGNLRFAVEQTPENLVRSLLFGQYSFPQAQDYFQDLNQEDKGTDILKKYGVKPQSGNDILKKYGL